MLGLLLTGLLLTQAPTAPVAPAPAPAAPAPTLSELHAAQVEAYLLRVRTLQLEVRLQEQALAAQQAKLDAAIAASHPGWKMDWTTGALVVATPAKEPAAK